MDPPVTEQRQRPCAGRHYRFNDERQRGKQGTGLATGAVVTDEKQ
jgi:hypothetical protein